MRLLARGSRKFSGQPALLPPLQLHLRLLSSSSNTGVAGQASADSVAILSFLLLLQGCCRSRRRRVSFGRIARCTSLPGAAAVDNRATAFLLGPTLLLLLLLLHLLKALLMLVGQILMMCMMVISFAGTSTTTATPRRDLLLLDELRWQFN